MSKEEIEVGDVWEVSYYGVRKKAYICNTKDYNHPLCVLNDGDMIFLYLEVAGIKYLGKSKVNIEDLFKTENE